MPGDHFEQAYNAQASVDMDSMLIVGNHVSQNTNDKQEVLPALSELDKLPKEIGTIEQAALDSGYFSEKNVEQFETKNITPYIAAGRQPHYSPLEERLEEIRENNDPTENTLELNQEEKLEMLQPPKGVAAMQKRLKSPEGKTFYAKRKSTVEPVFGIIKNVIGFRHFMLRGLDAVKGEWNLVCIAFNLKLIYTLNASKIA